MTPERYEQVVALFHAAEAHGPETRSAFLHQACGGDQMLRFEVEAMLAADQAGDQVLDIPPDDVASDALLSNVNSTQGLENNSWQERLLGSAHCKQVQSWFLGLERIGNQGRDHVDDAVDGTAVPSMLI